MARDLQSKHTYTKCLNSLRKYPLPLNTGQECMILEGFGDKICKLLDKKLEKFVAEGGVLHPDEDDVEPRGSSRPAKKATELIVDESDEQPTRSIFKQKSKDVQKRTVEAPLASQSETATNSSLDVDASQTSRKRKGTSREYMPEYRSGAYAILIALFNHESDQDNNGSNRGMLKASLIKEAQEHSDSSFSVTDANSHYTAWSSMSNLIKKQLAIKSNTLPAYYSLTEDGRDLALTLLNKENQTDEPRMAHQLAARSQTSQYASPEPRKVYESTSKPKIPEARQYVASDDCDIIIDDSSSSDIIVNVPASSSSSSTHHNPKKFKPSHHDNDDSDIIIEDDVVVPNTRNKNSYGSDSDSDSLPDINIGISSQKHEAKTSARPFAKGQSQSQKVPAKPAMKKTESMPSKAFSSDTMVKSAFEPTKPPETVYCPKPSAIPTETSAVRPKFTDIVLSLEPKDYEIILIVDTCETSHAKRQEVFLKELNKTGIKYEVSKLNIGDFAWIARSKQSNTFQSTDIMLDYIVERKRVDDLCQSIIDGRYKEQKFRLKRSGICNIVYLIEQFGSMKNFNLPEASIKQAIVNTQIIDGFFVKQTKDVQDSASYLAQFTRTLTNMYCGRKLNACLKEKLDEYYGKTWPKKQHDRPHTYLLTFQEFNEYSNKNKPPTIKEMFGRCLIQINGLSEEKCLAILDRYPTPALLFEAYKNCRTDDERMKMLSNLKYGKQSRNMGPVLSKLVATLFCTQGPFT